MSDQSLLDSESAGSNRYSPSEIPERASTQSDLEPTNLSPFANLSWQELAATLTQMRTSISDNFQLTQSGDRPGDRAAPRDLVVGPTQLLPNQVYDLQASFDMQMRMQRSLRWLRENVPGEARGISPDIIPAQVVQNLARGIHAVRERLAPGQPAPVLQVGIGQDLFRHVERLYRNDPMRLRAEIGVQLELFGRSLNQELARLGSPIRLGRIQVAVDNEGNTFFGLPVLHNGVQTNILRFSPVASPQEIQRRRDSMPRLA